MWRCQRNRNCGVTTKQTIIIVTKYLQFVVYRNWKGLCKIQNNDHHDSLMEEEFSPPRPPLSFNCQFSNQPHWSNLWLSSSETHFHRWCDTLSKVIQTLHTLYNECKKKMQKTNRPKTCSTETSLTIFTCRSVLTSSGLLVFKHVCSWWFSLENKIGDDHHHHHHNSETNMCVLDGFPSKTKWGTMITGEWFCHTPPSVPPTIQSPFIVIIIVIIIAIIIIAIIIIIIITIIIIIVIPWLCIIIVATTSII